MSSTAPLPLQAPLLTMSVLYIIRENEVLTPTQLLRLDISGDDSQATGVTAGAPLYIAKSSSALVLLKKVQFALMF